MLFRNDSFCHNATSKKMKVVLSYVSFARKQRGASCVHPRSPDKSPDLSLRSNHAAILPAPLHRVHTSSPLLLQTGHGGGRPDVGWTMRSLPIWAAVAGAATATAATNTTGLAVSSGDNNNKNKTEQHKRHPERLDDVSTSCRYTHTCTRMVCLGEKTNSPTLYLIFAT